MVIDALRAYVQLASGLTDVTRERAVHAAKALVAQVGVMNDVQNESAAQVRALADELSKTARSNRDLVLGMIRSETERAVTSVGAASAEELATLKDRVDALERQLAAHTAPAPESAAPAPTKEAAAEKSSAREPSPSTPEPAASRSANDDASPSPDASTGDDPVAALADIPTPVEVKAVVDPAAPAKKAPAKKAPAKKSAGKRAAVAPGEGEGGAAPVQDPTPPDVSTS